MNCIIADDEHLVRYSIQDMLEEIADSSSVWFESISQAVDGKDLLNQVRLTLPDLVFVDIKMPFLNGLDAMEQGRLISPNTQWIILTGYAEFDYAKRAIALGALDYLLKPASRNDVERVVQLALSHMVDKRAMEQVSLEHRILGLLQDTFSEDVKIDSHIYYCGMLIALDAPYPLKGISAMYRSFLHDMRVWMRCGTTISSVCALVVLDDGNLACVLASAKEEMLISDRWVVAHHMLEYVHAGTLPEAQCTIILQELRSTSLTTITHAFGQLSKYMSIRLIRGLGTILEQSDYELLYESHSQEYQVLSLIDKSIRNRELEPATTVQVIRQNRNQLESLWDKTSLPAFFTVYGCPDTSTFDNSPEALDAYIAWFSKMLSLEDSGDGILKRRQIVQRALDILATQFTREIGLAQVADMLGITPNYLSTEFNRAMGESFPQYVTRMRMEKAESLLKTGRYTVKDVASEVGYVSSRHFGKLFKKYFGHVPSEHPIVEP